MDIIKNPVVLGVIGAAITYFYMQYKLDEENKIREKKGKKIKELNLLVPLAVGVIVWIISYMYFNSDVTVPIPQSINIIEQPHHDIFNQPVTQTMQLPLPIPVNPQYRFINDVKSTPINLDLGVESNGFEIIDHTKLNSLRSDFIDV